MMEAPKRIWANTLSGQWTHERDDGIWNAVQTQYIRSDLVDKLIEKVVHPAGCGAWKPLPDGERALFVEGDCICGLSDLIKEIRG